MKKWKPGQVRLATVVLAALALLLVPLGAGLNFDPLIYAGLACYILVVLMWFRFHRCPHCKKHLGRHNGLYCPYCGEKL